MTVASNYFSADDLWALPDDGQRHELVKGELRTMAPSNSAHGGVVANLTAPLGVYVRSKKLGATLGAETGFIISRNPDTVRAPDIAFVRANRIPAGGLPEKFFPGPPDLAVEVVSPSDTVYEVEEKVEDWLAAGTTLVWIVNSRKRTVTIYASNQQPRVLNESDLLRGEDVIPGFEYPVKDIF
jgi:Uma2 family endonuclease